MKVSTVIAAYNADRTLAQALDSVLGQDIEANEIIVVNDGSTDGTSAILATYRQQIRVIEQANQGAASARNTGVAAASGKYVAFLDSDDLWAPQKLSKMVAALECHPTASLAFSEYSHFSSDGMNYGNSSLGHAFSLRDLMETALPPILTSTWVLPKEMFDRSGGFCSAFRGGQGFEDSWLLLLLRELGYFVYVPEVLTCYRIDNSGENADKYGHALGTFIKLSQARYGRNGKSLRRNARNLQCRFLQTKLAHQLDRGERFAALLTLAQISRVRPAYFFNPEFLGRLYLPQNSKRIWRMVCGD
jgi:glycosyltransferase involved in cell wall biosynthesis